MKITVVTLFPELFTSFVATSLVGKACARQLLTFEFVNPRDFADDKHRSVDDTPFGGGPGMVMKAPCLVAAIESAVSADAHIAVTAPSGKPFVQADATKLAQKAHLIFVCGRYEGIDERVFSLTEASSYSIGDFVMQGGEVAAMAMIEAVTRLVPGVIGDIASTESESFSQPLLEHAHYTRPQTFREQTVPEVLRSGDHARIEQARSDESLQRTAVRRPDLFAQAVQQDRARGQALAARIHLAHLHHPVLDRAGEECTTSVTNLDIHDIARLAMSYSLGSAIVVTPIEAQQQKVEFMIDTWTNRLAAHDRSSALGKLRVVDALDTALADLRDPLVVATTAAPHTETTAASVIWPHLLTDRDIVLVFGSGWGLSPAVIAQSHYVMNPILKGAAYNHLSVRSAQAIVLDRFLGPLLDPALRIV